MNRLRAGAAWGLNLIFKKTPFTAPSRGQDYASVRRKPHGLHQEGLGGAVSGGPEWDADE
jgi:hypothetical protein